jgi:CubicO group peptidase (beta-lactamase class C family)
MEHTGVSLPTMETDKAALGTTRSFGRAVVFSKSPFFRDPDLTLSFSAGAAYSTVLDLYRWDRALASDAALGREAKKKLFTPVSHHYACGWVVTERGGLVTHWHNGAISPLGFSSAMLRAPQTDTFVVYLSNLDRSLVDPKIDERIAAIVRGAARRELGPALRAPPRRLRLR